MKVEQLNEIVIDIHKQITGNEEVQNIDSTNIVDVGKAIFDNTDIDNYVKALVDRIGKVIFVNRKYNGNGLNVLMDKWEFGSVLQKIDCTIPNPVQNKTWALENGQSYGQDTFYQPTVTAKLFNKKTTFEIDVSFTELQVKSSFNSMEELNAFVSMIYNAVENSFTVKLDGLIMATINAMTGRTLKTLNGSSTNNKAVNLLYLYNQKFPDDTITKEEALTNTNFLKFASMMINTYVDRMSKISKLFNIGGKERFTPKEDLNIIMLSDFKSVCNSYLQADTFHKELVELPNADTVPYWQGSGSSYGFESVSKIHTKIDANTTIEKDGILCVMFDKNAVAVCNEDRRVTTHYNAKGEFFTNFYKFDCSYINDENENYVVFFIDDDTDVEQVATPEATPDSSEVDSGDTVELSCDTTGATIYYTVDGSTPDEESTKYTEAISITDDVTIKAIAVKDGMSDSEVATFTYTIAD